MHASDRYTADGKKYLLPFPKASGAPTVYIDGYPYEDNQPMSATRFHGVQIVTLSDQLRRYFGDNSLVYVGIDTFIYYREGDRSRFVAPDIYVALGVEPFPQRRSFYTWAEGAVPAVVFEFLSDATAAHDRGRKVRQYLIDIGVQEYFIHQPEPTKPVEFRGWRRKPSNEIEEIPLDEQGGLYSRVLHLWFRWEIHVDGTRLMRPYLPDGAPILTSDEEEERRKQAEARVEQEEERRREAEATAREEAQRRRQAEAIAHVEVQRRQQLEEELERLRAELAQLQGGTPE
jgi:Uma2 family endonuclease